MYLIINILAFIRSCPSFSYPSKIIARFLHLLPIVALSLNAASQNVVSGSLLSVPSNTTPTEARVTFTNLSTQEKYSKFTTDGNFSISMPTGNYRREFFKAGDYYVMDTIAINSSQTMNMKLIEDIPVQSTVYQGLGFSLLKIMKFLTSTDDQNPSGTILHRANLGTDGKMRIYPRNYSATDPVSMPQSLRPYYDQSIADITSKTNSIVSFREEQTDSIAGTSCIYPTNANMPVLGALGFTEPGEDHSICYFNRQLLPGASNNLKVSTFDREFLRALLLQSNSIDPSYIM